eukprot:scaffold276030_cov35-Tisochrysis_lutea.AAC.1
MKPPNSIAPSAIPTTDSARTMEVGKRRPLFRFPRHPWIAITAGHCGATRRASRRCPSRRSG